MTAKKRRAAEQPSGDHAGGFRQVGYCQAYPVFVIEGFNTEDAMQLVKLPPGHALEGWVTSAEVAERLKGARQITANPLDAHPAGLLRPVDAPLAEQENPEAAARARRRIEVEAVMRLFREELPAIIRANPHVDHRDLLGSLHRKYEAELTAIMTSEEAIDAAKQ